MALFSDFQNRFLSSLARVLSFFSLSASLLLLVVILRQRRKLLKNVYDRLIFCMNVFEMLSSFGFVIFGPWSVEEKIPFVVGARSTSAVPCDTAGFFAHSTVGTIMYTGCLMVYFILLIRYEWRPERIAHHVEPWMHVVAIGFTLATAVTAVEKGYMNPYATLPGVCWITAFPPNCEFREEVPCFRGEGALSYVRYLALVPLVTVVVVTVTMVLLVLQVRATEKRMARYNVGDAPPSFERTRQTCKRGLAYIFAFFIAYIPRVVIIYLFTARIKTSQGAAFFTSFISIFSFPMQGVFNAFIYLRPKWKQFRREHSDVRWLSGRISFFGGAASKRRSDFSEVVSDSNNENNKKGLWSYLCCCCCPRQQAPRRSGGNTLASNLEEDSDRDQRVLESVLENDENLDNSEKVVDPPLDPTIPSNTSTTAMTLMTTPPAAPLTSNFKGDSSADGTPTAAPPIQTPPLDENNYNGTDESDGPLIQTEPLEENKDEGEERGVRREPCVEQD